MRSNTNDATLLDEALGALVARNRAGEIDAAYAAYDEFPIDESDAANVDCAMHDDDS